jgi:hypothetical protein
MTHSAVVAGTGFEGREIIIRKYCRDGMPVVLKRERHNPHDSNAIGVYIYTPRMGGLLGKKLSMIGHIEVNAAKSFAKRMDSGEKIIGHIKSFYAPPDRDHPRVTLHLNY